MNNKNILEALKLEEEKYFANWQDECCGNFVGFLLKFNKFNIIVNRSSASRIGTYDLTIVAPNINPGSDPFNKRPEIWDNRKECLSFGEIKDRVNALTRKTKIEKIKENINEI